MAITPLPAAPSRSTPATFSDLADAFLAALATFVTEANALETNVNAKEVTVVADTAIVEAAKAVALAAANYKGDWSAQSGAAAVPYAVSHLGKYWQLVSNLADVTAKTPGTDAEWLFIGIAMQDQSVADEGSITLETGKTGHGWAMAGDNEEYIEFRFTAAGVVTVISNTANAINTDTDGNLCVYDAGAGIAIKNRLGATKVIRYAVHYS